MQVKGCGHTNAVWSRTLQHQDAQGRLQMTCMSATVSCIEVEPLKALQ